MYTPILATLGYILSENRKQVLMVHRNKRQNDQHLGKYNGLGGKMEAGEDIASCMAREIYEEAAITCLEMKLRGTINWTGFGPNGEDWFGFIYLITKFSGTPVKENEEGKLVWVEREKIMNLPMWEGDRHFLPLVFDDNRAVFHGYMPYKNNRALSWSYQR